MFKLLIVVRAGSYEGAALTSQVVEFGSQEEADRIALQLFKLNSSLTKEIFKLY